MRSATLLRSILLLWASEPHLRAPLGIAVLGNRVIVSQSPDLIVYTKDARDRIVTLIAVAGRVACA
jgi:hypothetical protein